MSKHAPVRVGVAGWDYPDWKGVLYPSPKPRGFDPVRYLANYIDLIEIQEVAETVSAHHITQEIAEDKTTQNVDVVFNNHYKAQAVVNAVQFKALMSDEPASVPPLLYESYPDELAPHAIPEDPAIQAA